MESDKVKIVYNYNARLKRSRATKIDFPLGVRIDLICNGVNWSCQRLHIVDARTFFAATRWRIRIRWALLLDRVLGEPKE